MRFPFKRRHGRTGRDGNEAAASAGSLFCDYVNEEMLKSAANQHEIELAPAEVAREQERDRGIPGLKGVVRLMRRSKVTTTVHHDFDPNDLLKRLLERLERKGQLHKGLGYVPADDQVSSGGITIAAAISAVDVPAVLGATRSGSEARPLLAATAERRAASIRNAKLDEFAHSAPPAASVVFALVEGEWSVGSDC